MQQQTNFNHSYRPPQRRGLAVRILPWLLIALALVLVVLFGIRALRDSRVAQEIEPYEDVFADNIHVDGIDISRMAPQEAYDAVFSKRQESVSAWSMELTYNGHTYVTINYQTLGLQTNVDSINQTLKSAWDLTHTGDAYQKKEAIDRLKSAPWQASTVQNSEFNSDQLGQYLTEIANYIEGTSMPSDAYLLRFDPNLSDPFVIQKEQIGYHLDIDKARQQILEYAAQGVSGKFELQPEILQPAVTEAMLRENMQLRSIAQTEISSRSEPDRTENIRISSDKISGTILKPGAEFSFNKTAEERTLQNGYRPAMELVYGYYESGVGGGVCQTSTTIYQAALLSDLQITTRRSHAEPVNYADPGVDATVYWTKDRELDFKFKNNTNHDLYIVARVKPGASSRKLVTEVVIYGEPLDPGVQHKLKTVVAEVLYPSANPKYISDKDGQYVYFKDEEVEKSPAKEGKVVETYLQKYVNGQLVEEKLVGKSTYVARQQEIYRGVHNR